LDEVNDAIVVGGMGPRGNVSQFISNVFNGMNWSSEGRGFWNGPRETYTEFELDVGAGGGVDAIRVTVRGAGRATSAADEAIEVIKSALRQLRVSHGWYSFDLSDNSVVE
jgi:hypothetical protein